MKTPRQIPYAMIREFVSDVVMIAKNRGLTFREGRAGMAGAVRLMKSLQAGEVYDEKTYIERVDYLVRAELEKNIAFRLIWEHGQLGVELLSDDLRFVRKGTYEIPVGMMGLISRELEMVNRAFDVLVLHGDAGPEPTGLIASIGGGK